MKYSAGIGFALVVAATGTGVGAESLMLAHGFNPNHYWSTQIIEPWMACVEVGTSGEYSFQNFPSGQIVKFAESMDAMRSGLTDVSTISVGYETTRLPLNGVSMLPDMGETSVQMVSAYRRMLDDGTILLDEFTNNDVQPLIVSLLPVYQLITRSGPITTLDGLQGKVIRSSGGALTLTVNSLGASATEMPSSDVYVAFQNGVVDVAFAAISSIKPYNLEEVVEGVSTNGQFGSFATLLAMKTEIYAALPEATRQVFDQCGLQVEKDVAIYLDAENETLKTELSDMGIEVYDFPPEMQQVMLERMAPVTEEFITRLSQRGLPAKETYDAYRAALDE
ncbi:MAG: TRAP transporter substrate-binding protein DctP [Pseudorhodobacter sp.]